MSRTRISTDLLRDVFALSPAAARVAVELMNGREIRKIAKRLEVSVHTVRTHVRSVLAKTGAGSQKNLTRLLALGLGALHLDE
ncbi:MAG TPA: LuxR C-terminal-related transcriptional regulator [Thermoanaerobaculia bacterium]|nr:LuxR C-terminal-related transcriptional regulator [Thermoanaerobaculia bacterium]